MSGCRTLWVRPIPAGGWHHQWLFRRQLATVNLLAQTESNTTGNIQKFRETRTRRDSERPFKVTPEILSIFGFGTASLF
ncbi:hypothetical protein [Paraburkholderia sp. J7]|uniref:hypothetical protein n=1 Tax=Paraburkholderia sp. J7 TaxID=2805438 RepID=UPI002AB7AC43|nr:hypothetical protein [Paraburkholderia sp. J7]